MGNLIKLFVVCMVTAGVIPSFASPVNEADTLKTKSKGDERNVMLNASDANKPREIQIGLPSEDINVYENGLPAVYSSTVHKLSSHWRSDNSQTGVSLMDPSESAIATGNIAYAVNSKSNWGQKDFHAVLSYHTNQRGWQNFDFNASGGIAERMLYTASVYQNFDPGNFNLRFTDYADRTQLYQFGLTYLLDKGSVSLKYKHSRSCNPGSYANAAPFIYNGDGSVSELPGFHLGTGSYVPNGGSFPYMDVMTGEMKVWHPGEGDLNFANEISLVGDYTFNNGWNGWLSVKYMDAPKADYVDFGGSTITEVSAEDGYKRQDGTVYVGLKEGRRTWLHVGKVRDVLMTAEMQRSFNGCNNLKIGLNEWFYDLDYHSSSFQWDATVEEYPEKLNETFGYNELSSEFTRGYENKLALYVTDEWQVNRRLNLFAGARLEYYRMSADRIPTSRFSGFHIGASTADGQEVKIENIVKNKLNYAFALRGRYDIGGGLGLTADATIATRYPRINEYAGTGPTEAQYKRVTIPLVRAGVTYRNEWVDMTSMFSYIGKTNNIDQQNLTRPGSTESKTVLLIYDIQTIGWTTSVELTPFKGAHLHALLTLQKPTYRNYNASVTFSDGQTMGVNANGMVVKEIPRTIIELDPSYNITDGLRLWLSFRYFGRTYANLQEALYFNGRWETFGGINWDVNKHLALSVTIVNFLNQKGASGTISGSELISKEEASKYAGNIMSGSYLRPFTVEFGATLKF